MKVLLTCNYWRMNSCGICGSLFTDLYSVALFEKIDNKINKHAVKIALRVIKVCEDLAPTPSMATVKSMLLETTLQLSDSFSTFENELSTLCESDVMVRYCLC